ncbi:MAG: helix-hairpin-helix domain-containing protein [Deltaproteobacteria bacterium]|nr:helix-hairpin-helix domain-containing protein [Deltaproteobacteria bacterium]
MRKRPDMAAARAMIALTVLLLVWSASQFLGPAKSPQPPHPYRVDGIRPDSAQAALLIGQSIDPNLADETTLALLPGIGPALAERIVKYRATHGPFRSIDDIAAVPGIGPRMIVRLRPWIAIGP